MRAESERRSRTFIAGIVVYFALLLAAFLSGRAWLDDIAVFALLSVFLLAALRRRSALAWSIWLLSAGVLAALGLSGNGRVALDALPIAANTLLCVVFARTVRHGRQPLIARLITLIEGAERLTLPRVAGYARHLTQAWAALFGVQAVVLLVLVACVVPDGWLAMAGVAPPIAISPAWRWYLHLGSYAMVPLFLVLEYAYRRWRLRAIPHASLVRFLAQLARSWPALLRSFAHDPP